MAMITGTKAMPSTLPTNMTGGGGGGGGKSFGVSLSPAKHRSQMGNSPGMKAAHASSAGRMKGFPMGNTSAKPQQRTRGR